MKRVKLLLLVAVLIGFISLTYAQETITPEDAAKFIGQQKTVCGLVVNAHYETRIKGRPTILNLNKPYPKQVFSVLIWGSDRGKFDKPPETLYSGKKICVTGMIQSYRGGPGTIVRDPSQIKFMK
jgi:hypothetical protein